MQSEILCYPLNFRKQIYGLTHLPFELQLRDHAVIGRQGRFFQHLNETKRCTHVYSMVRFRDLENFKVSEEPIEIELEFASATTVDRCYDFLEIEAKVIETFA